MMYPIHGKETRTSCPRRHVLPLVSHCEYIDCQECLGISQYVFLKVHLSVEDSVLI